MFKSYLTAGYPLLWARTLEPHDSQEALSRVAKKMKTKPFAWNIQDGVTPIGATSNGNGEDPLAMIKWLDQQEEKVVLFALNLHLFLESPDVIQAIQNGVLQWKKSNKTLVILSPVVKIPVELERLITVFDLDLPNRHTLGKILEEIISGNGLAEPENKNAVIDAAVGLTAFEAENAMALSVADKGALIPEVIYQQKAKLVEQSSSLEMSRFSERFADLGGLENLKAFTLKIARSKHARGILLVGVPGCGKSLFAKALGNELSIPSFSLDLGRVFASKVGESEERIRRALQIVDAMAPAILFIDEMEKGLGGIASSNKTDGGTGSRVFGTFLTWLNDHQSQVFVVATTNNISHLPPEFLRAERWDGIFFVDLPNDQERQEILTIHKKAFELSNDDVPDLGNWSGAEIRSLCRIAAMMGSSLKEAGKYIVPLSQSMSEELSRLRNWAKTRAIPASEIRIAPLQTDRGRKVLPVNGDDN